MGRSVSVPSGAKAVVYLQYESEEDDDEFGWTDYRDCIASVLQKQFPSLVDCKYWLDNEERVFLENRHAQVVIAEYCGCVSVSLVPKQDDNHYTDYFIARAWCELVSANFEKVLHKAFSETAMKSVGHMSNGCQAFIPVSRPEGMVTSNEGTLW